MYVDPHALAGVVIGGVGTLVLGGIAVGIEAGYDTAEGPSACAVAVVASQDAALEGDPATAPPAGSLLSYEEADAMCAGELPGAYMWEDGSYEVILSGTMQDGLITYYGCALGMPCMDEAVA